MAASRGSAAPVACPVSPSPKGSASWVRNLSRPAGSAGPVGDATRSWCATRSCLGAETLVEPLARGHPQSPLRWTCKSTRTLAAESRRHHPVSHEKVAQLLRETDYSLQGNRKTEEGADHPDRYAQFQYINDQVRRALAAGRPVISVDTKKKELIGNYENQGRQWRKTKTPPS